MKAGRRADSGSTTPLEKAGHLIPASGNTWILDSSVAGKTRLNTTRQEPARQEDPPTQENLTKQKHITEQNLWKTRILLLSDKERNAIEAFVERKMEEGKERILIDDWDDEVVRERLHQVVGEMLGEEQWDLSAGIQGMKFVD